MAFIIELIEQLFVYLFGSFAHYLRLILLGILLEHLISCSCVAKHQLAIHQLAIHQTSKHGHSPNG